MDAQASQKIAIVEVGSCVARAGFSTEPSPRVALSLQPFGLQLSPREMSELSDPELLTRCWNLLSCALFDWLQIVKMKDSQVLVIESVVSHRRLRNTLALVLYKYLFIGKVSFQPDLLLPLLSTGAYSGVVLDIGYREARCIAIVHGRPILQTIRIGPHGALKGVESLERLLAADGRKFSESMISQLFTKVAAVQNAVDMEVSVNGKKSIVIGTVRTACVQSIISGDDTDAPSTCAGGAGAVGVLLATLLCCSADVLGQVLRHVVICGGAASIPGLPEAVCAAASARATSAPAVIAGKRGGGDFRLHKLGRAIAALPKAQLVAAPSAFPRCSLAWVGGSIFASNRVNQPRFAELSEVQSEGGELALPDWLNGDSASTRFIGGCDPLQEVRSGVVVKLGFKRVDRASNPDLQEYTTFFG